MGRETQYSSAVMYGYMLPILEFPMQKRTNLSLERRTSPTEMTLRKGHNRKPIVVIYTDVKFRYKWNGNAEGWQRTINQR